MNNNLVLERYKGLDLNEVGVFYSVRVSTLTDEEKELIESIVGYDLDPENETVEMEKHEIDGCIYNMPSFYNRVDWSSGWIESEYFDEMHDDLLKKSKHVLVVAHNCNWKGSNGYKIADNLSSAMSRNYETTQILSAVTKSKKAFAVTESSHDVPMGARTTYIALTDGEYRKVENWLFFDKFDRIEAFINKLNFVDVDAE